MKKTVFLGAVFAGLLAFGEDVATLEAGLRTAILEKVNAVNPIDSATGQRKYISFGFITDIHKCKRVPGDDATTNPVTDYWYGSAGCLTEAEQSIRLLGSVASDAGLDAVINGGDLSTAPIVSKTLKFTVPEYTNEIWNVKKMFDKYIKVPFFTVSGNHDRAYTEGNANFVMSTDEWAYVLTNFNSSAALAKARGVDVIYHRDLAKAKLADNSFGSYSGNTFDLDFRRLYATKGYNVRICCLDQFDTCTGSAAKYRTSDSANFHDRDSGVPFDPEKTNENTIMGLVDHGHGNAPYSDANSCMHTFMNGTHKGKGFFGLVCGHAHFTEDAKLLKDAWDQLANPGNEVYASMIRVAAAYAVNRPSKPSAHELGTEAAYHFSIFIIDPDSNLLHEVRVGGWHGVSASYVAESPVVQLHQTNIRTHLDPSAPTEPTTPTEPTEPEVPGDDPTEPGDDDPVVPAGDPVDITALVRAAGKAAAKLEQGVAYSADYGAEHAFDGDTEPKSGAGRFMGNAVGPAKPTAEKPMVIRYDIGSDFESGKKIVLSSLKIIIGGESWGVDRSPTKFALYGVNGDDETMLFECTADPGWATAKRTLEFPFENGKSFRSYRLKIFANKSAASSPYISLTEVIFYGHIVDETPPPGPEDPQEPDNPPVEPTETVGELSHYKWAVIGDSLSDPTLLNKDEGPLKYYHYLQQTSGIRVVYTNGVGSTGYKAGAGNNKCFYQRLEANPLPSDVDVVTIFGSVNDGGSADTEEHAGLPTDALPEKDTLAAYINKALDLVREQAPNAKIILSGGLFFENSHPDRHIRVNETLRQVAAVRGVAFYDWLTENPDDPLDFHQIVVNKSEEGCFGSLYTYDWATRGRIGESFGHPNALYNEIWLAPHFGEALAAALKPTLGGVTAVPAETNAVISGTVVTLGVGATSCDVYLAVGADGQALGAATKIATGLTAADSFQYTVSNLTAGTAYCYKLSVSNNAAFVAGTSIGGSFTTKRIAVAVDGLGDFAKKVTFTVGYEGTASLGGMPVLVKIAADRPAGFRYSDCEADGSDIRFADAEGKAIPFEIDTWNPQGESFIWVKASAVTKGTAFTMYYSGTPSAANESSATWADYTGVWHLNDLGADTTAHSKGLYPNSTATAGIDGHLSEKSFADEAGLFGKAFRTNDSTGWNVGNFKEGGVWVNDGAALDAGGVFTISGWFKHNDWSYNYDYFFSKRLNADNSGTPNGAFAVQLARNGNDNIVQARGASSARTRNETSAESLKGVWTYLTVVYNGTSCSIYENGALNSSGTIAAASDNDEPLVFGNNVNVASGLTGSNAWNGWIDEVRYVKGVAKSAEWVAAEYKAMAGDAFVTASAVTDVGSETPPVDPPEEPETPQDPPDDPPEEPSEEPEDAIEPSGDASGATDAQVIQAALDAAVPTKGTVTLGKGLFMVKTQLKVTGGVTLEGQGWTNTVIKFALNKDGTDYRVATVSDGGVVRGVAMTGGRNNHNTGCGGGVQISGGGTISWCCITNNYTERYRGGGVYVGGSGDVCIDHTIIADNAAATKYDLGGAGGGICVRADSAKTINLTIDDCLIAGNTSGHSGVSAPGGGIVIYDRGIVNSVIRNTTIAGNAVVGTGGGGGLHTAQGNTTLVNCIFADNAADSGDGNIVFATETVASAVAGKASNCLFGNGTTAFGAASVPVSGSVGFVDAAAGDYHLAKRSPAVGKGASYDGLGNDLDNKAFATPPSIGCYEYVADGKKTGLMIIFR